MVNPQVKTVAKNYKLTNHEQDSRRILVRQNRGCMIQTVPEDRHGGFQQRNQNKGRPAELLQSIGLLIDIDLPPGKLLRS